MKNLLLIFACLLISSESYAQLVEWFDPIEVADYATGTFEKFDIPPRPKIAVTESGVVNIVWANMQDLDANTAYARLLPGEDTFSSPIFLNDGYLIETWSRFGPSVAAQGENVFVCFEYAPTSSQPVVTIKSTDAGETWASEVVADEFLNGDFSTFPSVAIDGGGDPHVVAVRQVGTSKDIGELCSVNGGISYTSFVPAEGDLPGTAASPPFMVIDGDRHLVIWTHVDISENYYVYGALSTNDGASFNDPVILNDVIDYGVWLGIEDPEAVVINNNLYLTWPTKENGEDIIRMSRIPMGDLSLGSSLVLSNGDANDNPTIAANDGTLLTIWQKSVDDGPLDLYFSFGLLGAVDYDQGKLFFDDVERYAPSLVSKDGFHLTYVDKESDKIMYMYGQVSWLNSVDAIDQKILLYPNPASSFVHVESDGKSMLEIFDVNGKMIEAVQLTNKLERIDISDWSEGVYLFDLKSGERSVRERFVKQ